MWQGDCSTSCMVLKTALTIILLSSSILAAEQSGIPDRKDFEQPGVIQLQGVGEKDEVRVDGELLPAKGLARVGYNLLVAPGEYVITVKLAASGQECVARVTVHPGERVRPNCLRSREDLV